MTPLPGFSVGPDLDIERPSRAGLVREPADAPPLGVLKVVFGLGGIDRELMRLANESGLRIELLDAHGLVIAASSSAVTSGPVSRAARWTAISQAL